MHIEVTGETEKLIQAALATGKYESTEAFIAAMARGYRLADAGTEPLLPKHLDADVLAAAQGVPPVEDFRDLKARFWPEHESVDAFVSEVRAMRDRDKPRIQ